MSLPLGQQFSGLASTMLLPGASHVYDTTVGISGVWKPESSLNSITLNGSSPSGVNGTALAQNLNRKMFQVQNCGTGGALYVYLGTGACSTNFSYILSVDTAVDAGKGGVTPLNQTWQGPVSCSGVGFVPRYIAWETY